LRRLVLPAAVVNSPSQGQTPRLHKAQTLGEGDAYIFLLDPQGRFVNVIQGSESGEQIAAWLRKQMAHPSG
jgi:hypothetical protein